MALKSFPFLIFIELTKTPMRTLFILFIFIIHVPVAISQTREKGPWWPNALWGPQDEAGASNWITPEKIMKALTYAKEGKVYELGHPYERTMPMGGTRSYKISVVDTGPAGGKNKQLGNEEVITGEIGQVGTQVELIVENVGGNKIRITRDIEKTK